MARSYCPTWPIIRSTSAVDPSVRLNTSPGKTPRDEGADRQQSKNEEFERRDVLDVEQLLVGHLAEHDAAIEREHVDGREDDAERRARRRPGRGLEAADHGQDLADEAAGVPAGRRWPSRTA